MIPHDTLLRLAEENEKETLGCTNPKCLACSPQKITAAALRFAAHEMTRGNSAIAANGRWEMDSINLRAELERAVGEVGE